MDQIFFSFLLLLSVSVWIWKINRKPLKLPPGPKPLPIIGNILQLGDKPHTSLTKLSHIYGPLIHLKLGMMTTIVVSSPDIARLIMQKNDKLFSNRKAPVAHQALDHHKMSVVWLPVENQWRKLRKICKEQLFSVPSLESTQGLRKEKLQKLCDYVRERCLRGEAVEISTAVFVTSLNLLSATIFSQEFAAFDSDSSQKIMDTVTGILNVVAKPNLSDYFPILRFADPQRIFKKTTIYFQKFLDIFNVIIDQRLKSMAETGGTERKDDLLQSLIDIYQKKEDGWSIEQIKHLLFDLFTAGTDTSSGTVEWALSELLKNPEKLRKTKTELRDIIGTNKQVTESDIVKLPYLRAVVKETFRLHPPGSFLLPRAVKQDFEINGYIIPENANILINIYAIGRDPENWPNPELFLPERFLESEIDSKGHHFELIPFGSGRRICPGMPLGNHIVHMILASLIQNFDWKLDGNMKPQELDMDETFGVTLKKANPLRAIPLILSEK